MNSELIERMEMHNEDIRQTCIKMNNFQQDLYKDLIDLYDVGIEIWKGINDYDKYEVSTFGRVRNVKTDRMLKPRLNSVGYHGVLLCNNGKPKNLLCHRLCAITFIPNTDNKSQVDHIDNDRTNNHINNLRWTTCQENSMNSSMKFNNTSGYKGVHFHKNANKWCVQIKINGKNKHLGYFINKDEAIETRKRKAKEVFGEYMNSCEL
jgi:hypothetical protein